MLRSNQENIVDTFDPYANDGPIEYAVKTGDPSRGASMRDDSIVLDEFEDPRSYGNHKTNSLVTLALALTFLVVAFLSL